MPRLILMRHAKSSWAEPGVSDHARTLNRRGRLAASLMAAWLREAGPALGVDALDLAIVSDAQRTRETWDLIAELWSGDVAPVFEPRIYEARVSTLLEVLRDIPDSAGTALMIGHNPGLQDLTALLTGKALPRFPTAATAILDCPDRWSEIGPDRCSLLAFEEPKAIV